VTRARALVWFVAAVRDARVPPRALGRARGARVELVGHTARWRAAAFTITVTWLACLLCFQAAP